MLEEINPGTLINNRYQIQKVLGQGGFGRTYLATDTQRFGDACVLKEFVPANRAENQVQKSRELFEREARVLYQINHPQIPKFLAWFTDQERVFIVQEYIDGKTYSQLLQERLSQQSQSFSEPEVIQWLRDLLSVLDYLHGIKILHRDISLDNVMLPHDQSKPVLIDFGLVKEKVSQIWYIDSQGFQHTNGTVLGRIGYASPEQIRMGQSYPSSDLYALGVCAIVLLTGKMPDLLMDQSLEWQWRPYADISDSLAQILDKMLAEKPKQRYQSAKEILFELEPLTLPSQTGVSQPLKKVQIHIDQAYKARQVAEIIESDDFKLLEQQANKFRTKTETATESHLEAETHQRETPSVESMISLPAESLVMAPEPLLKVAPMVETPPVQGASLQSRSVLPNSIVEPVSSPRENSIPPATHESNQSYPLRARLIHLQTNRQIELPPNLSVIRIGKANERFTPEIDVSTFQNSGIVSRIHAKIYVEADGFYIEDMKSVNGTYINDWPLLSSIRYRLKSGDCISLGMENLVRFLFQLF